MAGVSSVRTDAETIVKASLGDDGGDLSARVLRSLLDRGYTPQGLADALGVGKSFLSLIKSGRRSFRLEHLQRLEGIVGSPLPLLLLEVYPAEHLTPRMQRQLTGAKRAIKESGALRRQLKHQPK